MFSGLDKLITMECFIPETTTYTKQGKLLLLHRKQVYIIIVHYYYKSIMCTVHMLYELNRKFINLNICFQ